MAELLCPVCGQPTNPKPYGPFFTPDPVYRWADTCQLGDWRGPMRATIAAATQEAEVNELERAAATAAAAVNGGE